jgi:hypothetical protein
MFIFRKLIIYIYTNNADIHIINRNFVGQFAKRDHKNIPNIVQSTRLEGIYVVRCVKPLFRYDTNYTYQDTARFINTKRFTSITYTLPTRKVIEIVYSTPKEVVVYEMQDNEVKTVHTITFPIRSIKNSPIFNKIRILLLPTAYITYQYVYNSTHIYMPEYVFKKYKNAIKNHMLEIDYHPYTNIPVYSVYSIDPKTFIVCYYNEYGKPEKYWLPYFGSLQRIDN